jgi:CheY-like chemotaxis protein
MGVKHSSVIASVVHYDMVLAELRVPGLDGSDLALEIRRESPSQRITMMTDSVSVERAIRRKLGNIPVLKLKNLRKVRATDLPKPHNLRGRRGASIARSSRSSSGPSRREKNGFARN